jgi:hypothetical protein
MPGPLSAMSDDDEIAFAPRSDLICGAAVLDLVEPRSAALSRMLVQNLIQLAAPGLDARQIGRVIDARTLIPAFSLWRRITSVLSIPSWTSTS